jgi:uncharacterized protein (DUF2461 family)
LSDARKARNPLEGGLHPAIDLIRKNDWILDAKLDPALATTPRLFREIAGRFRVIAPMVEFLNRLLLARKPARKLLDFLS